jgi:PAS domain-containing protein
MNRTAGRARTAAPRSTALRRAEARAALAEQRLRAVVDAIPEGIVLLDADGRYVLWNQRYSQIYHRSADLLVVGGKLIEALRIGVVCAKRLVAQTAWRPGRDSNPRP